MEISGEEVAGLLSQALRREVGEPDRGAVHELAQDLGHLEKGRGPVVSDVDDLAESDGAPSRARRRAGFEPMKPSPPVIRIFRPARLMDWEL